MSSQSHGVLRDSDHIDFCNSLVEPPLSNSLHDGGVFCTFGNVQLYGSYQDQTFLLDTFWGEGVGEVEVDVAGGAGGPGCWGGAREPLP